MKYMNDQNNKHFKVKDKTYKTITDVLAAACHVPINEVCVLEHDEDHFKAYVHGTSWYCQRVYDIIEESWSVDENKINVSIEKSPKGWWPFGSTGYLIEVNY